MTTNRLRAVFYCVRVSVARPHTLAAMSQHDPLDIKGTEEAQAAAEARATLIAKRNIDDIKWLMSDKRGRRIVSRLLDLAGLHRPSIDQNTASMAFKEGKRWFGTLLVEEIEKHCFDRYIEMLQEQKQ